MAEGTTRYAFPVDVTRKWLALAERRRTHLVDLYETGRWRLYYSEREFVMRLREAVRMVEQWSATEQAVVRKHAGPSIMAGATDQPLMDVAVEQEGAPAAASPSLDLADGEDMPVDADAADGEREEMLAQEYA